MATLQLKSVPEQLHARLRERAKAEHLTMRDYVLRLIEDDLERLSIREWSAKVGSRKPLAADLSSEEIVEIINHGREERSRELLERVGGQPSGSSGDTRRR